MRRHLQEVAGRKGPVFLGCLLLLISCVTYAEELNRGQRYFQGNEYERALAVWRVLETDIDSLSPMDRARYAYLRGMSDYRMSLRADARHWLALARAYEQMSQGSLEEGWRERMRDALQDLADDPLNSLREPVDAGSD